MTSEGLLFTSLCGTGAADELRTAFASPLQIRCVNLVGYNSMEFNSGETTYFVGSFDNISKEKELVKDSVYAKFAYTATDHKVYQVAYYNLDVVISVGYRVKSIEGTRFRQWATRVLREMLLNRLEEVKRIGSLERRADALENDVKHIKGGMDYLFKQVTSPDEPPRRRIGFGADENDTPRKPYAKL